MAKFVGSHLITQNKGEDFVVQKLIDYCDDGAIVYRNRKLYGAEFDSAILIPGLGAIIFEVKDWDRKAIIDIPNGDRIRVWQYNKNTRKSEQKDIDPSEQARGYTYKLRDKIKEKTGKDILVYSMVCFPSLSRRDYLETAVDVVCEEPLTFVKEEFETKKAFLDKLNKGFSYHKNKLPYRDNFDENTMFQARRIFEANISAD